MSKIQVVEKSRKECRCFKCGSIIPVGSKYYKGILFHLPPLTACTSCGLKHYEVTTSDYVRTVGAIVEDWNENYTIEDGVWATIAEDLEQLKDELEERLYNIPEQLQNSNAGTLLQERIDALDTTILNLTNYESMNDFLQKSYEELDNEQQEIIDDIAKKYDNKDFEEWYNKFMESTKTEEENEVVNEWREKTEEAITEFIENALSELEY